MKKQWRKNTRRKRDAQWRVEWDKRDKAKPFKFKTAFSIFQNAVTQACEKWWDLGSCQWPSGISKDIPKCERLLGKRLVCQIIMMNTPQTRIFKFQIDRRTLCLCLCICHNERRNMNQITSIAKCTKSDWEGSGYRQQHMNFTSDRIGIERTYMYIHSIYIALLNKNPIDKLSWRSRSKTTTCSPKIWDPVQRT